MYCQKFYLLPTAYFFCVGLGTNSDFAQYGTKL